MNLRGIIALTLLGILLLNLADSRLDSLKERPDSMQGSLVSSWFWVQGYGAWLNKDEPRLIDSYRFATALNPAQLSYWRLAAQTIAFDLPVWNDQRRAMTMVGMRWTFLNTRELILRMILSGIKREPLSQKRSLETKS